MKLRKIFEFIFLILVLIIVGGLVYLWKSERVDVLSPMADKKEVVAEKNNYKVVGFLPTYMVGKTVEYTDQIDELIFLGVEVEKNGDLIWDAQGKKINSETYLKQKNLIWENGGENILGIKLFDDEKLDEFINSSEAQDNLITQIKQLKKENNFDGVNIDFEYQNDPTGILSEKFMSFLNKLKKEDLGEISLDVFVNTINKGSSEQIGVLINLVDSLIIMAYDFHRPGMDYAGSVAPIQSKVGDRNIMEVVEKILDLNIDKEKIIMAYPLYGYEWKTYTKDFESQIIRGWYQMASWSRTKGLIKDKKLEVNWDELSMTPWMTFEEDGVIHQIYYENEKSLGIKLDLVKQNQFGGVGFWALGYEGEDKSVWEINYSF